MIVTNLRDLEFLSRFKEEIKDLEIKLYLLMKLLYKVILIVDKKHG